MFYVAELSVTLTSEAQRVLYGLCVFCGGVFENQRESRVCRPGVLALRKCFPIFFGWHCQGIHDQLTQRTFRFPKIYRRRARAVKHIFQRQKQLGYTPGAMCSVSQVRILMHKEVKTPLQNEPHNHQLSARRSFTSRGRLLVLLGLGLLVVCSKHLLVVFGCQVTRF